MSASNVTQLPEWSSNAAINPQTSNTENECEIYLVAFIEAGCTRDLKRSSTVSEVPEWCRNFFASQYSVYIIT